MVGNLRDFRPQTHSLAGDNDPPAGLLLFVLTEIICCEIGIADLHRLFNHHKTYALWW